MAQYVINIVQIKEKALAAQKPIDAAYAKGNALLQEKKKDLIDEFENHPVTKDLKEGYSEGINYLSPLLGFKGNLFGLIGFNRGQNGDVTKPLGDILEKEITLKKTAAGARYNKQSNKYEFPVSMPSEPELLNASPMPSEWSSGSFLKAIERGISGFSHFIYWKTLSRKGESRSLAGLQANRQLRSDSMSGIPYLLSMLKKFKQGFKR